MYSHSATSPESLGHLPGFFSDGGSSAAIFIISGLWGCQKLFSFLTAIATLYLAFLSLCCLRMGKCIAELSSWDFDWLTDCSLLSSSVGFWLCCRCCEHHCLSSQPCETVAFSASLSRFLSGAGSVTLFLLYTSASSYHLSSFISAVCNTKWWLKIQQPFRSMRWLWGWKSWGRYWRSKINEPGILLTLESSYQTWMTKIWISLASRGKSVSLSFQFCYFKFYVVPRHI